MSMWCKKNNFNNENEEVWLERNIGVLGFSRHFYFFEFGLLHSWMCDWFPSSLY